VPRAKEALSVPAKRYSKPMIATSSSWQIAPVDLSVAERLAERLGVSRVTAEVLVRRGFVSEAAAHAFLSPDFLFHSPYLLPGIAEARAAIDRALARGDVIGVHGDYDADGITATFLLTEVLRELGARVVWWVPNRLRDGYGVSLAAVEAFAEEGVRLLITVDCGVTAVTEVERAQALGMDVVVTDHHEPKGDLPACILVNPRLGGYPFPHLAGVGVALKLAHALLEEPRGEKVELPLALRPYTDVVAVGTVADVMPLLDENRLLVKMGLGRLQSSPRPGLAALLEVTGTAPADVSAATLGYRLGPRLNAAGRLDDASLAVELLSAPDRATALPLALKLNELNIARQDIEASIVTEALAMIPDPPPAGLVLSSPDWHEGVVGIVAARLAEKVNRPAILLSESDGMASGSGRSIPGFDLLAAVTACSAPLHSFGGHRAACGLRMPRSAVPAFREAFTAYAAARLRPEDLVRRQDVDAIVCGDELTLALADELERFDPHGLGNPPVTLLVHGAEIRSAQRTRNGKHVRASICADGASCSAIRFNADGLEELADGARFDVPLVLTKNAYNGVVSGQVEVRGLYRVDDWQRDDLCASTCSSRCPDLLDGDTFWRLIAELDLAPLLGRGEGKSSRAGDDRAAAAVIDRRGRPIISTLTSLAASGERVLVLVADVGRRRPLLTRDLPLEALGLTAAYVSGACAPVRVPHLAAADGPRVVMASSVTAALFPELTGAFAHIVFIDPPFWAAALDSVRAAAQNGARLHFLWGPTEVDFARKVAASEYDVRRVARRLYATLKDAAAGSADAATGCLSDDLARKLIGSERLLYKIPALVAAWRTLVEAGLLAPTAGKNLLVPVAGKADITSAPTFRLWHRQPINQYLRRCQTAQP